MVSGSSLRALLASSLQDTDGLWAKVSESKYQSIKRSKTAPSVILESSFFHSQNSDIGFFLRRIALLRNTFKSNHQFSLEQNFIYLKVSVQEKNTGVFFVF